MEGSQTQFSLNLFDDDEVAPAPKRTKTTQKPTKKVLSEWDDDAIGKLILCVEHHPCLWNPKLKDYKNRNVRDAAWKEIRDIFDEKFSVDELNAKWANLRIQFKSYASKVRKTKSGQAVVDQQVHWRFFKPMLFIQSCENDQYSTSETNLVSEIFIMNFIVRFYIFLYCHSMSPSCTKYCSYSSRICLAVSLT